MILETSLFLKDQSILCMPSSKGDYDGLHEYLLNSNFIFCSHSHNVEAIWLYIEEVITTAMRLFIPYTRFHSHQHHLWFISDISHHIKCVHTLRCKFRYHPSDQMAAKVKSLETLLKLTTTRYIVI